MTVRLAHPSHRWHQGTATCRLCGCPAVSRLAGLACLKAQTPKRARSAPASTPNLHAASLVGARDLTPRDDW
jgi:hypothetical protein